MPKRKAAEQDTSSRKKVKLTAEDQELLDTLHKVMILQENMARLKRQFAECKKNSTLEAQMRGRYMSLISLCYDSDFAFE